MALCECASLVFSGRRSTDSGPWHSRDPGVGSRHVHAAAPGCPRADHPRAVAAGPQREYQELRDRPGVAVVFSVLNFFLGWLIRAVLFVPALLTLGLLFLFVPFIVNAALLWLTDKLMASFEIKSLRGLLVSAAVITLVNGVFYAHSFRDAWYGYPDGSGHHTLAAPSHPRWI